MLHSSHSIPITLRQDLSILDRLDGTVVIVLVDLFVDRSIDLFTPGRLHCLLYYGQSDLLMDGSIIMSSLRHDVVDSLLSLVYNK